MKITKSDLSTIRREFAGGKTIAMLAKDYPQYSYVAISAATRTVKKPRSDQRPVDPFVVPRLDRLRAALDDSGLTVQYVADMCRVRPPTIHVQLSGKNKRIKLSRLVFLLNLFGVPENQHHQYMVAEPPPPPSPRVVVDYVRLKQTWDSSGITLTEIAQRCRWDLAVTHRRMNGVFHTMNREHAVLLLFALEIPSGDHDLYLSDPREPHRSNGE